MTQTLGFITSKLMISVLIRCYAIIILCGMITSYKNLVKRLQDSCQDSYSTPVKGSIVLLQHSCKETIAKVIEYFSLILQCTTTIIRGPTAYYIYSFIKMANEIINELLPEVPYDPPKSEVKRQKLIECVLTGNSKQYLRKAYTEEQANKLSAEEVDKLFNIHEVKLSGQMVKSLGKSIIRIYSTGACAILGMNNQDA